MGFLGKTLREIASQKAGIIKKGCHVVTAAQVPEVMEVIDSQAAGLGCPLTVADAKAAEHVHYGLEKQRFDYGGLKKLEITLAGQYQIENAVTALEGLRALGIWEPEEGVDQSREQNVGFPENRNRRRAFPVGEDKLRQGLAQAGWPGRFAVAGRKPYFILDGAHNPQCMEALARALRGLYPGKKPVFLAGVLADKDWPAMLEELLALAQACFTLTPDSPRALPAGTLAEYLTGRSVQAVPCGGLREGLDRALAAAGPEGVVCVCGSLYMIGEARHLLGLC